MPSQTPSYERSRNIAAVLAATLEASKKIGAAIGKVASELIGMIFK